MTNKEIQRLEKLSYDGDTKRIRDAANAKLRKIKSTHTQISETEWKKNPASKVPLNKFLPVRFNPNGTITVKLPRKRVATKKKAKKRNGR